MFNFESRSEAYSLFRSRTRKAKRIFLSYGIILFFLFSIFLVASLYMMRANIIASSNSAGNDTAQRLDIALKYEFVKEKQFLEIIAHYADLFLKSHYGDEDGGKRAFDLWLRQTKDELQERQRDFIIDIYASIDGQIIAPTYWDGDPFLIPEARPWYQEAMKAEIGHATILDPYIDIYTNSVVTTIATRIGNTNNVIAVDLYLETSAQAHSFASMVPDNFSFYLVDSAGTLILYYDDDTSDYTSVQNFVNSFFHTHVKNRAEENNTPIIDPTGAKRNVFTSFNPITGWYTITTNLYSDVLFSYHTISNLFLLLVVVFIIIEVWMVWREYHLSSQIETSNEALKVLGNSYQIILRVNFKLGTFTTLKAPDHMRMRLATRNNYDDLLSALSDMILPENWTSFYKTFSLNHLRNLASLSIRDFGHDYQLKLENDERYKWFNARILFDESLDLDESILCFKLIDEEKINEIEEHKLLADALENAKRNEESKNVFFSNMSHDMRTPLNGIIGLCQIGINHMAMNDTKGLPDLFRKMTTASKQLLALVDDILEVARPQMENRQNLEPFDIVKAVEENIDVFKVNATQQGKEVNLYFDIKHNVVIGDAAKLRQILNNLVSNSLKYSNKGCVVNVSIREVLHLHKPSFMIEVQDTGIGMDRKFLSKLFDAYSREHRINSVQGTGLGMSIVKNVVTIMGGDIKVKSAVDVGTTFTINIPFRLADEATAKKLQQDLDGQTNFSGNNASNGNGVIENKSSLTANAPAADSSSNALPASANSAIRSPSDLKSDVLTSRVKSFVENFKLHGLNILIVEDNELNMEIACDILQMQGVNTSSAWNGKEAVEVFKSKPEYTFDAILMDMRMPQMNGCEASAAIRALGRGDSLTIPIIACTANAFTEDITATQNAGMNAHVSKPLDFGVLERVLKKLVSDRVDLDKMLENKEQQSEHSQVLASANTCASLISTTSATPDSTKSSPSTQANAVCTAASHDTSSVNVGSASSSNNQSTASANDKDFPANSAVTTDSQAKSDDVNTDSQANATEGKVLTKVDALATAPMADSKVQTDSTDTSEAKAPSLDNKLSMHKSQTEDEQNSSSEKFKSNTLLLYSAIDAADFAEFEIKADSANGVNDISPADKWEMLKSEQKLSADDMHHCALKSKYIKQSQEEAAAIAKQNAAKLEDKSSADKSNHNDRHDSSIECSDTISGTDKSAKAYNKAVAVQENASDVKQDQEKSAAKSSASTTLDSESKSDSAKAAKKEADHANANAKDDATASAVSSADTSAAMSYTADAAAKKVNPKPEYVKSSKTKANLRSQLMRSDDSDD